MESIDIANALIIGYGDKLALTNLKLNKLVYFAQVESIRDDGSALFDDRVEAWQFGPVTRAVYDAFKRYGRGVVTAPSGSVDIGSRSGRIIAHVASTYGKMSAFDLVALSHREGGAWSNVYSPYADNPITVEDIKHSVDMDGFPGLAGTVAESIDSVASSIPNALKLLRNS